MEKSMLCLHILKKIEEANGKESLVYIDKTRLQNTVSEMLKTQSASVVFEVLVSELILFSCSKMHSDPLVGDLPAESNEILHLVSRDECSESSYAKMMALSDDEESERAASSLPVKSTIEENSFASLPSVLVKDRKANHDEEVHAKLDRRPSRHRWSSKSNAQKGMNRSYCSVEDHAVPSLSKVTELIQGKAACIEEEKVNPFENQLNNFYQKHKSAGSSSAPEKKSCFIPQEQGVRHSTQSCQEYGLFPPKGKPKIDSSFDLSPSDEDSTVSRSFSRPSASVDQENLTVDLTSSSGEDLSFSSDTNPFDGNEEFSLQQTRRNYQLCDQELQRRQSLRNQSLSEEESIKQGVRKKTKKQNNSFTEENHNNNVGVQDQTNDGEKENIDMWMAKHCVTLCEMFPKVDEEVLFLRYGFFSTHCI